jgi:hypothetical protein
LEKLFRLTPDYQGVYDYEINLHEVSGLSSFNNIDEIAVIFEYKIETGQEIETPRLDIQPTAAPSGGGGGGGGSGDGGGSVEKVLRAT